MIDSVTILREARPCPFCASSNFRIIAEGSWGYSVRCQICGARGPSVKDGDPYGTYNDGRRWRPAVEAWNGRRRKARNK